jgi:hypothetical protein
MDERRQASDRQEYRSALLLSVDPLPHRHFDLLAVA